MDKSCFLGIDTSNYTTSAALLKEGRIRHSKKLLPVEMGKLGLRQSDAVFHHTRQLFPVLAPFLGEGPGAIGVSVSPRNTADSYMPCFLAGLNSANILGGAYGVKVHGFSHQQGHLAAALFSCGSLGLINGDFIAFHLSGGTSEVLLVRSGVMGDIQIISKAMDLNAGQAVDRVGLMLGLPFPCGRELEALALECKEKIKVKPSLKAMDFSFSGIENQCRALIKKGASREYVAAHCMESIIAAMVGVTQLIIQEHSNLPLVFSGGVSSNRALRARMQEGFKAMFAEPEFSADNAAGPAILAALKEGCLL